MIVKIEQLSGDGAEKWLSYARAELRRFEFANPDSCWVRFRMPEDGVLIRLRQVGDIQYIAINAEGGTYMEFETSGFPVQIWNPPNPEFIVTAYKPAVVSITFDGTTAKPILRKSKRDFGASTLSLIGKINQTGLVNEPATSVTSGTKRTDTVKHFPRALYESGAPIHPYTGAFQRAINFEGGIINPQRGSWDGQFSRDVGFDIPWGDSSGRNPVRMAVLNNDTADWPRASGLQTVTHPTLGKREFAIYVDAFDQFFAFPTSQITAYTFSGGVPLQNIADKYVQQAAVAWPSDSRLFRKTERMLDFVAATGDTGDVEFPEYDWKLHPDGTKACAVMFWRHPADFDSSYYTDPGDFTQAEFDDLAQNSCGTQFRHNLSPAYHPQLPQRYFIGNGLVEVDLAIAITGANPEDYTFTATANVVRDPEVSPYCTFIAGYANYDIPVDDSVPPETRTYVADRGDLCVLDIERYYRTDVALASTTDLRALSFFSVKNLTKDTEVSTWWGGDVANANIKSQLVACDIGSLSFVFNMNISESPTRTISGRDIVYFSVHPSAAVVTFNKLRTVLFPDSMTEDRKATITEKANTTGRAMLTDGVWQLLDYSDTREWQGSTSDPDSINNMRNYALSGGHKPGAPHVTPSDSIYNWWYYGITSYYLGLIGAFADTAHPRFSWHAYADEILSRNAITARSTFYVHPSGSWWFYDQHSVYNAYGISGEGPIPTKGLSEDFIANGSLEHVIYDAVHLVNDKGELDTSFIDLYNQAVDALPASPPDTFNKITKDDIRAEIELSTTEWFPGETALQAAFTWGGSTWYFIEFTLNGASAALSGTEPGGGLIDLTLGDFFFTGPGATGIYWSPTALDTTTPFTVSSVVMLT